MFKVISWVIDKLKNKYNIDAIKIDSVILRLKEKIEILSTFIWQDCYAKNSYLKTHVSYYITKKNSKIKTLEWKFSNE